jgi:hypothetical protein
MTRDLLRSTQIFAKKKSEFMFKLKIQIIIKKGNSASKKDLAIFNIICEKKLRF